MVPLFDGKGGDAVRELGAHVGVAGCMQAQQVGRREDVAGAGRVGLAPRLEDGTCYAGVLTPTDEDSLEHLNDFGGGSPATYA